MRERALPLRAVAGASAIPGFKAISKGASTTKPLNELGWVLSKLANVRRSASK